LAIKRASDMMVQKLPYSLAPHASSLPGIHAMPTADPSSAEIPSQFPVSVLMARYPVEGNRWIDHRWEALGIVTGCHSDKPGVAQIVARRTEVEEVLYSGYQVRLHQDECEAYYHNLRAEAPCGYVITRPDASAVPRPFLISLSFDEAHAYLEGEDVELFSLPLPPALYRWSEAYVLRHYVPQARRKRARDNWKESRR
jgi:hypothetical protein